MEYEALNRKASETMTNLTSHGVFEELGIIDEEIKSNRDPFQKGFYLSQQDRLNDIFGELKDAYAQLLATLKKFIVIRKFELRVEYEKTESMTIKGESIAPSREPGNELLEDLAQSEIADVYEAVILLEGWISHCDNSIKTCRNHAYSISSEVGERVTE